MMNEIIYPPKMVRHLVISAGRTIFYMMQESEHKELLKDHAHTIIQWQRKLFPYCALCKLERNKYEGWNSTRKVLRKMENFRRGISND